jgi:hypothetical protein
MTVDIGIEAAQIPEKEYINGIFVAVHASRLLWDRLCLSSLGLSLSLIPRIFPSTCVIVLTHHLEASVLSQQAGQSLAQLSQRILRNQF